MKPPNALVRHFVLSSFRGYQNSLKSADSEMLSDQRKAVLKNNSTQSIKSSLSIKDLDSAIESGKSAEGED